MTGWRMGYLAAPKVIFDAAYKLYQHSLSCMSGFLQKGAVEAFHCEYETEQMRQTYAYRRDLFTGALNRIPGVRCLKPRARSTRGCSSTSAAWTRRRCASICSKTQAL